MSFIKYGFRMRHHFPITEDQTRNLGNKKIGEPLNIFL